VTVVVTERDIEDALAQRLREVSPLLLGKDIPAPDPDHPLDAGALLDAIVSAVRDEPTPGRMWLLCAAVSGSLPTPDDVAIGTRFFRLAPAIEAMLWILDYALETAQTRVAHMHVKVVSEAVVVDVDHTARHDLHTGIQQVVRSVVPLWARDHDVVPVVWTEPAQAIRTLLPTEADRVLHWDDTHAEASGADESTLIIPWRSVLVLLEVPFPGACERLAALAQFSDNEVVAIGYDCIPAVSANLVPAGETNRFARYLVVIKHARIVASIGATATMEFRGFASALPAQGLRGPLVLEVPLPVGTPRSDSDPDESQKQRATRSPLVLCVGTFEPRKNHMAILYAAERLWREGLRFELLLIGGAGWDELVPRTVARLQEQGRSVRAITKATGAELAAAYHRARFTVFASLHEGFGLPVAESLEFGTPVITTNFGSTAELARGGGVLLVNPHDDDELTTAVRRMLTDDALLEQLRNEIRARPVRTWEDYASELWASIVNPAMAEMGSQGGRT
jgi:glycosyltransferase involved in cell wall biosynthesis